MEQVIGISTNMPTWFIYVTIALGLISCFFGYKLLKVWIAFVGFLIGMALGYYLSYKHVANVAIPILIGFLLGLLVGFIAYRVYLLGVFIIAFVTTFGFIGQLLAHYNEPDWLWLILTLVLATVVAVLALKFVKPVIIIGTSLNGAVSAMSGIFTIMKVDALHTMLLAALLLALFGVLVQFFTNKRVNREK